MRMGCPYGTHRVLEPRGTLPQGAWRLDNEGELYDNEIVVDVDLLNVDSASFTQIRDSAGDDPARIAAAVTDIVGRRGKLHNLVTGSGGMFTGRVAAIGRALQERPLAPGDRIASLVSLSLTPLRLQEIEQVYTAQDRLAVRGRAILFESGVYTVLPDDLPEGVALAVLDVAGAPAQTARLVAPGDTVLVVGGGGKSGLLCLYEAKKRAGVTGRVIGISSGEASCARMRHSGLADLVLRVDATDPVTVLTAVREATSGCLADVTINCVNRPGTEMGSILATREGGTVYFFSMATSFTAAALGAEGVGKDVRLLIGNGYARGHAACALQVLRESAVLGELFTRLYS